MAARAATKLVCKEPVGVPLVARSRPGPRGNWTAASVARDAAWACAGATLDDERKPLVFEPTSTRTLVEVVGNQSDVGVTQIDRDH